MNQTGYVAGYYRLVGGIQIRQQRMSNNSCKERRFEDFKRVVVNPATSLPENLPRFDTKVRVAAACACARGGDVAGDPPLAGLPLCLCLLRGTCVSGCV